MSGDELAAQQHAIAQLQDVAGVSEEKARQLLEATSWVSEDALAVHFASGESSPLRSAAAPGFYAGAPSPALNGFRAATAAVIQRDRPEPREQPNPSQADNSPEEGWFGTLGRWMSSISRNILGLGPEDFEEWFSSRYGSPKPTFSSLGFGEANRLALQDKRLLLLWFHEEESATTETLCREVFQNEEVLRFIDQSYLLWGADVCRFEPGQVARLLNVTSYPTLVVCQPVQGGNPAIEPFCLEWPLGVFSHPMLRLSPRTADGGLESDEIIAALAQTAVNHSEEVLRQQESSELRRLQIAEERLLREEQDREYEEALRVDQLAEVAKSAQQTDPINITARDLPQTADEPARASFDADAEQQEVEAAIAASLADESRRAEELRVERGKALLAEEQPKPGPGTARLSLRLPIGDRMQRSFLGSQPLVDVYEWAHCCRPTAEPRDFALCTSFPTRTLTDKSATLEELGLCPSAALVLKSTGDD